MLKSLRGSWGIAESRWLLCGAMEMTRNENLVEKEFSEPQLPYCFLPHTILRYCSINMKFVVLFLV